MSVVTRSPAPGSALGTSVLKSHGLSSGSLSLYHELWGPGQVRTPSSLSVPLCKVDVSSNARLPSMKDVFIVNSANAAKLN